MVPGKPLPHPLPHSGVLPLPYTDPRGVYGVAAPQDGGLFGVSEMLTRVARRRGLSAKTKRRIDTPHDGVLSTSIVM